MVEIVVSVAGKVAEYLVAPVGRQFSYLCNYRSNFDNLKKEFEKLRNEKERVQHLVNDVERNGEEIFQIVQKWLISVNVIINEVGLFVGDEEKAERQCLGGLCPDLKIRYQLSKKARKEMMVVTRLLAEGKFDQVSYRIVPENMWLMSNKFYEAFESRMLTLNDILDALSNPNVNMIGVYGIGGVGKTTLVKEAARQAQRHKLFDEVVFAVVSQTPDVKKIQGEIADGLGLAFIEESESGRARRLCARLKKDNKILIILDDIWSILDLEIIGVPCGDDNKGCKVLLTSRSLDVLSNEMDSQTNFLVGILQEKEAWSLFKKMAGNCVEDRDVQPVAIQVVEECAGLPIAVVTVARALKNKNLYEWKNSLRELKRPSSRNFTGSQAVAYSTIELSYNHLESEELKSIFLLCSLLGYTYNGSVRDLLKYGVGLGLFKGINSMEETQDRVYALIDKLKASCLLLDSYTSEMFSMHDVVCDVAISIASRDQCVFAMKNDEVPREWLDKNTQKKCTAISLHNNDVCELPEGLQCPELKLFYLKTKDPFLEIPDNFFTGMAELKVLDLTTMHLLSLPSSLHLLVNLQTLCLDQCVLEDIAIIGELKKLEILSFYSSYIEQLPVELGQLTRLRFLDLSDCSKLKVIPPNVLSNLSRLEELYMGNSFVQWEVEGLNNERCNASLDELKHLPHLTTLEMHIPSAKILPKGLFSKKLARYRISIGDGWDWSGKYETSRTLKLKLDTNNSQVDGIIMQFRGVEDLFLDNLKDVKNVIYELNIEGSSQLKHLHIQNNSYFLCIFDSMDLESCNKLSLLESLFVHNLINLEKICHCQLTTNSFCRLRTVKVGNCDKLKNIFSFSIARGLPELQVTEVIECKNMEEIFAIGSEDDINNNEVIDKIVFGKLRTLILRSLPRLASFCSISGKRRKLLTTCTQSNEIILENAIDIPPMPLLNEKVLFPNLEALELSAINVEKIWHNQLAANCIQNLTRLIVQGCGNLKSLFPSSIVNGFVQLRYLEICKCVVLEEIVVIEDLREGESNDILFPQLNYLKIEDLGNLKRFYSGNYIEFPSLKQLQIDKCPEMKAFISTNISSDITAGKDVEKMNSVENQGSEIQPFFDEKVAFPILEELVISHMGSLKMLWHNQLAEDSFRKLKLMKVDCCDKLLTVFSCNILRRFSRLESLTVADSGSIEEIFGVQEINLDEKNAEAVTQLRKLYIRGLPKLSYIWNKDLKGYLSFQNLQMVRVSECQSLKYLFPASIARSLLHLEKLYVENCGVEEIVGKEESEVAARFVLFPQLSFLKLWTLPELRAFYPGAHTSEWLVLKRLAVYHCDIIKIIAPEFFSFKDINTENQLDILAKQPIFLFDKVFPNLEELTLSQKDMTVIWQGQFHKLKVLQVVQDESSDFPLDFLKSFCYLEELVMRSCSYKEIFLHRDIEKHAGILAKIKVLKFDALSELKHIWKQDSKQYSVLRNVKILHVWNCHNLINLVPSSASLENLTTLNIQSCDRLINLITPSTARSLVQLTKMSIVGCKMITEIVANEGDATRNDIILSKLKWLSLHHLPRLTSFCSGNYAFEFPSLEQLIVNECPGMKIFSRGVSSTPRLWKTQLSVDGNDGCWDGDVNTTIQRIHRTSGQHV